MARLKVLIAGGGIGGITAMLALRQRGIDVQLFEQAAAFSQVGAGLQVSSNAARILLKLGLGEALKRVATYPEGRDYRGWDTGERLYYTPLGQKAEAHQEFRDDKRARKTKIAPEQARPVLQRARVVRHQPIIKRAVRGA